MNAFQQKLLGALALSFACSGCAGTFADPPTASRRLSNPQYKDPYNPATEYEHLSPMAEHLINSLDANDKGKRWAADTAWRCENRLNNLSAKMRSVRNTKSGITITSGVVTVLGALTTTILASAAAANEGANKDLDVGAVVAASVTATSSVAALIGSQIEDPATLKSLYDNSLSHHNKAYKLLLQLNEKHGDEWSGVYYSALLELNECAKEELSAKTTDTPEPPKPTIPPPDKPTAPPPHSPAPPTVPN